MIAKGNRHSNGAKLARYLTTGKEGERAELIELRGFESPDITDAFRHVHVMAGSTRCTHLFFHVQVRNPPGEDLTPEQRIRIVNRLESKLGLKDQPRAVALHIDQETGESHIHAAWSLIDENALKARPLPFFKTRLKEACRELEFKLALTPVRNERDSEITYAPTKAEEEQARRLGLDVHEIRETIRTCYDRSDCGRSLNQALAQEGIILAQGDRRDYLAVYEGGGFLTLGKKVLGATAAQVRTKLADLDRAQLPTLEQAREQVLTHELAAVKQQIEAIQQPAPVWDRDAANRAWEEAVIDAAIQKGNTGGGGTHERQAQQDRTAVAAELTGLAAHIRDAWQHSDNMRAFGAALAEHGIGLAQATRADAVQSQIDSAEAKIAGRWKPTFREGEIVAVTQEGQVWQLNQRTTGDKDFAKFLDGLKLAAEFRQAGGHAPLPSIADAQRDRREERRQLLREVDALKAPTEPELNKAAGDIRLAYNLADGPQAFKQMLEQSGLTAARAAWQDIRERDSATTPEATKPPARLSDHAREGDVVILDKWGKIHELNQRTTGDTRKAAQAFVAGIGQLPSISHARRELEEKRQQPIRVPTGPQQGGLVAHQMSAVRRLAGNAERQRREQQRRDDQERRTEEAARKTSSEIDPQRYLTDPDYRREVRTTRAHKTPEERKADRANELRAQLEQQDRQR